MANTPFLNLVKPADTDQALITDINSNSDKIDAGVSSLSDQIASYNIGSGKTVAETQTALVTLAGTMTDYQFKSFRVNVSSASGVIKASGYLGTLKRYSASRLVVEMQSLENSTASNIIVGQYESNAWTWGQIASGDVSSEDLEHNGTGGKISIIRHGKIRIINFGDFVMGSSTSPLASAVPSADRPNILTGSAAFGKKSGAVSIGRIWMRTNGTLGTDGITEGTTVNGEIVYVIA